MMSMVSGETWTFVIVLLGAILMGIYIAANVWFLLALDETMRKVKDMGKKKKVPRRLRHPRPIAYPSWNNDGP